MTKRNITLAVAVITAILLVLAFALWPRETLTAVPSPRPTPSVTDTPTPTQTPTVQAPASTPSATETVVPTTQAPPPPTTTAAEPATKAPRPTATAKAPQATNQHCVTNTSKPFTPTSFRAYRMGVDVPTMTVGLQDGAAGSPPKNQPYKVAWFDGSPRPGSDRGHVVLTSHTYSAGQALGNDLYGAKVLDKRSTGTKTGDVWALTDGTNIVCYEITDVTKVMVSDYDPHSNLIYDYEGPEELVMVICWDKNWGNGDWDSRVVFTAKRI